MKTKLLPSLSEVSDSLKERKDIYGVTKYKIVTKLNDFLKQAPELYMFVPCDKEGNVLEKPTNLNNEVPHAIFLNRESKYKKALERVIFDFDVIDLEFKDEFLWFIVGEGRIGYNVEEESFWVKNKRVKNLADLAGKVYLNENGIKDSGI